MYSSPNMGLTIWDQLADDFDSGQLATNFAAIDSHDHSTGKGLPISGASLVPASVTQAQLAANSVGEGQIQDNSVDTDDLQDGSVTGPKLAPGSVGPGAIAPGSITAALLDPTLIPLGQIVTWWRPPGSLAVPGGYWEIMDGRPWNTITNAWGLTNGAIPDLRGRFVQGADLVSSFGPALGATGGSSSANLSHTHQTLGHSHTVPAHAHTITVDGAHLHLWQGGLHMGTRPNTFQVGTTVIGVEGHVHPSPYWTMYIQGLLGQPYWQGVWQNVQQWEAAYNYDAPTNVTAPTGGNADMDAAGLHTHGGSTGFQPSTATSSATETTDVGNLGNSSVIPPFTGLAYIMRCR